MSVQFRKELPTAKWADDSMDCRKKLMFSTKGIYQVDRTTAWQRDIEGQAERI